MKVAVSSTGKDLDARIDPRFGRCAYFAIVETETMDTAFFDNANINQSSGAGIQTASFIANQGVKAVLTGNCGPKAMQVLTQAGIQVFTGQTGTVKEAIAQYTAGSLTSTSTATVPEKSGIQSPGINKGMPPRPDTTSGGGRGMGGGGGRGMGGGGGRGMGGGGGRGMGGGGGRGMGGGGGRGMGGGGGRGMGGGGGQGMGGRRQ